MSTQGGTVSLFLAVPFKPRKDAVRIVRTYGAQSGSDALPFKGLPRDWNLSGFQFVNRIEEADFVLVPQAVKKLSSEWQTYFDRVYIEARAYEKEIILFIGGDRGDRIHVDRPHVVVFKGSEYASRMYANEILMPGYAEDVGREYDAPTRHKSEKPIVSFCGYAGFPNLKTHIRYCAKNTLLDAAVFLTGNKQLAVYKRGIYFRRRALSLLSASDRVATNFIIRTSFSGNVSVAKKDPKQIRQEYVDTIVNSDFVLAPKGDGNYSIRFYEALSLGRIPLLIDTDMRLPFENDIDYSKCVLRVPHTELSDLPRIVADFYDSLTGAQYQDMQAYARSIFHTHLRYDAFFNRAFSLLKEKGLEGFRSPRA